MIIDEFVAVLGFDLKGEENLRKFKDGINLIEAGLSNFVNKIADFGKKAALGIAAIGTGVTAVTYGMFKLATSAAKPLEDMLNFSNRVGGSFEKLQEWQYAAQQAGSSAGEFQKSVQAVSERLAQVARGTGQAKTTLKAYGISATDASGKTKDAADFLLELSGRFENLSSAQQLDLARKMGLSSGIITMLKSGREEIEKLHREARDSGLVFTEDDAKKAAAYNAQLTRFDETIKALRHRIGVQFMPVLTDMMDRFQGWYVANRDMIQQNIGLWGQRVVAGLQAAMASLGRFWWGLGKIAEGMSALFGRILGKDLDISKLQALAAVGALLARVFAPVYFTIAAILLMVDDFIGYMRGDKSVFGALVEMIEELTGLPTGGAEMIAGIVAGLGALVLIKANPIKLLAGAIGILGNALIAFGTGSVSTGIATLSKFVALANVMKAGVWALLLSLSGDTAGNEYADATPEERAKMRGMARDNARDYNARRDRQGKAQSTNEGDGGRDRALDDYLDGPRSNADTGSAIERMLAGMDNLRGNLAKMESGAAATINDNRQDHRDQSVNPNITINQTVTQATQAPAAAAQATGQAVGRAAVPMSGRLAIDSAF